MKPIAATALVLALAACSGPTTPPAASNETTAEVAPSGDIGIVAPTDAGNAQPSPPPAAPTPAASASTMSRTFPAAYRGRWGMNANDCDPQRADNKGLITVSADALKFYESRATVAALTISSPTRLSADLNFSGEGQTWQSRSVLELADGGRTLVRSEETPAESYRYAKCPAA